MNDRPLTHQLLSLIDDGVLKAEDVLKNILTNWESSDDAEAFVWQEYGDYLEDVEDEEQ